MAFIATAHCLTGCAIGEILGMVIGTAAGMGNAATVALSVALAFVFGYALTFRGGRRAGLSLAAAVRLALAADTISIAVMELVDNGFILAVPGAMDATLSSALFWGTLIASLAVAFVVTVPVNRLLISRGLGHAAAHHLHEHPQHAPTPRDHGQHDHGAHDHGQHDHGAHEGGREASQHGHHHAS
jgi:hypothetical protein